MLKKNKIKVTEATESWASKPEHSKPQPDSWGTVPEIAGCDFKQNAKIQQRYHDQPHLRTRIMGSIINGEMGDEADDGTNFLGYCHDN